MILKLKMRDDSKKNIDIIKSHFFDSSDKITNGYIIGLAVERTTNITDKEWKEAMNTILYENGSSKITATSISLRHDIFEKINTIKEKLQDLCGKKIYMSQVIDVILFVTVNKLCLNKVSLNSLMVMEWNMNGRAATTNLIIPVNLISNEVFDRNPHIFVFTEFVQSIGWVDLKSILEEKYYVFESPYFPKQNGVCIGIKKEIGIEYLETVTKTSVFDTHLNSPDFYEVKVRINSQIISIIGTRIRIDCCKACSKKNEVRISEQKQRFDQYVNLIDYIVNLENVIILGDFNNSRIIKDENEDNIEEINNIYKNKDSFEYNFQKIKNYVKESSNNRILLHTASGPISSVGAICTNLRATAPKKNNNFLNKYDHIISNYSVEKVEYDWIFLNSYNSEECFSYNYNRKKWEIKAGYPDHAILLATIKFV